MATFNASNAELLVFTFKEGLLSKVAHDLKLTIGDFTIDFDEARSAISASAKADSLAVVCCMKKGREVPGTLSDGDKAKVLEYTRRDVLHPARHDTISFTSSSVQPVNGGYTVEGTLSLHGVVRAISVRVSQDGGALTASFDLDQRDYGIKPFSALLGAMKVKPVVTIKVTART
jgi:hypothetical protein